MEQMENAVQKENCIIDLSADCMSAEMSYQPGDRSLTAADVAQMLENINVTFGINKNAIEQGLRSQEDVTIQIAKGQEPKPGKNGSLTFFVDYTAGLIPPKIDWSGAADYREIQVIPEIKEGTLIARKNSPLPGVEGRTVTGKAIAVAPVKEAVVQYGTGVYEKGNQYFASFSGRLSVEKRGHQYVLDVSKRFIHPGNVDLSSGNVRFQGDIEVQGSVENTMRVEAAGDIDVLGQLTGAIIIAGRSASVGQNVFSSTISSGKVVESTKALTDNLSGCLPSIIEFSKKLDSLLSELKNRGQAVDEYAAAQTLMERTCPELPAAIKRFAYETSKTGQSVRKEWSDLANKLYRLFIMKSSFGMQKELLKEAVDQAALLHSFYQAEEEDSDLFVSIPYAVNSQIVSNKHIYITGQGIFNSTIKAGGHVEVSGCVKGGSVQAKTMIKVKEAGSESGVKTTFCIDEEGRVEFLKVYPEVTVQFGQKQYTFFREEGPVCLFVNENGSIQKKAGLST